MESVDKFKDYLSIKSLFQKGLKTQNRNLIVASVALFAFKKIRKYASSETKGYKLKPGETIEISFTKKQLKN